MLGLGRGTPRRLIRRHTGQSAVIIVKQSHAPQAGEWRVDKGSIAD